MTGVPKALAAAFRACARCGVKPARYFLSVNIARQTATLFRRHRHRYIPVKNFRCSTSKFGIGEIAGSNMTPRGLHRVAQKIGGGWPVGAAFKARQMIGYTWDGQPGARIAHRILWLEGLEPGFNRGGAVDSFQRYIYIHGTGDETTLGRPDSHGCIHLSADDLIRLYDKLPEGTLVWIAA
jgi:L,D-transpeptidase YbiS